jgi:hypothetical protein
LSTLLDFWGIKSSQTVTVLSLDPATHPNTHPAIMDERLLNRLNHVYEQAKSLAELPGGTKVIISDAVRTAFSSFYSN